MSATSEVELFSWLLVYYKGVEYGSTLVSRGVYFEKLLSHNTSAKIRPRQVRVWDRQRLMK